MHALERRPPIPGSRVPHFELAFYLTMELLGRVHPCHRHYDQWDQMSETERQLHREDMVDILLKTADHYDHSALLFHPRPETTDELVRQVAILRERDGDRLFTLAHGDATYAIPDGHEMLSFSYRLVDEPDRVKDEAQRRVDHALEQAAHLRDAGGLDGFILCSDYCLTDGPFLSPGQFSEFIAPYLKQLVTGYREMGFYVIKHTDGNIMPIIDQIVDAGPHALHSLDPQAGVDLAEVKRLYGDQVCLCGNVNCGLMQTGTEEEALASARYALQHGMPGGGYIFCTSNCIYTGLPLERYELIQRCWKEEGVYA